MRTVVLLVFNNISGERKLYFSSHFAGILSFQLNFNDKWNSFDTLQSIPWAHVIPILNSMSSNKNLIHLLWEMERNKSSDHKFE